MTQLVTRAEPAKVAKNIERILKTTFQGIFFFIISHGLIVNTKVHTEIISVTQISQITQINILQAK